jgi:hypothetical protein
MPSLAAGVNRFPLAPKAGWYQSFDRWMRDLAEERYIAEEQLQIILAGVGEFEALFAATDNPRRQRLQRWITRFCQNIVQERWEDVRAIVREFESAANP